MKRTQMRDTIKDIKYFNTFINEEQARVKKFSDKLKNGEVRVIFSVDMFNERG